MTFEQYFIDFESGKGPIHKLAKYLINPPPPGDIKVYQLEIGEPAQRVMNEAQAAAAYYLKPSVYRDIEIGYNNTHKQIIVVRRMRTNNVNRVEIIEGKNDFAWRIVDKDNRIVCVGHDLYADKQSLLTALDTVADAIKHTTLKAKG